MASTWKPKPDVTFEVPFGETILEVSPTIDILYRWQKLGAYMMKYWAQEQSAMQNIWINQQGFEYLRMCGVRVLDLEDKDMFVSEYEQYLETQSDMLREEDFGLEP